MGNYYCKNCSVPLDYYSVENNHHLRQSCRHEKLLNRDENTYHQWKFYLCFIVPIP